MIDKKAIEELAQTIFAYALVRPSISAADALAQKLHGLGYHKISGEPPVLNEEEIVKVSGKAYGQAKEQGEYDFRAELIARIAIAQAQRDADIAFYNKEEQ